MFFLSYIFRTTQTKQTYRYLAMKNDLNSNTYRLRACSESA